MLAPHAPRRAHEVSRWIPGGVLRPIAIQGSGVERQRLWAQVRGQQGQRPNPVFPRTSRRHH